MPLIQIRGARGQGMERTPHSGAGREAPRAAARDTRPGRVRLRILRRARMAKVLDPGWCWGPSGDDRRSQVP